MKYRGNGDLEGMWGLLLIAPFIVIYACLRDRLACSFGHKFKEVSRELVLYGKNVRGTKITYKCERCPKKSEWMD